MEKTTNANLASSTTKIAVLFLVLFYVFRTDVSFGQDFSQPDSAYYQPWEFRPNACTGDVSVHIPVYLWSDGFAQFYGLRLRVLGYNGCDSAATHFLHPCEANEKLYTCNDSDTMGFAAKCYSPVYITPGKGVVGDFYIRGLPGDTISVTAMSTLRFTLSDYMNYWYPTYMHLDTQIVIPMEYSISPGDADASGLVSISDAVYLIQYIFAGGCAPFDAESADVDGSCQVTVSDAVYLINYTFAGGPPPQAGCVGP